MTTIDEALAAGAPLIHPHREEQCAGPAGAWSAAMSKRRSREADVVVEDEYETGFVEHAYIEPEAGFARRVGDRIEIQACTQSPYMDRADIAKILGIAPESVRIIPTAVGGGFGSKLDLSVQPFVALAAWHLSRPVRMVYSRIGIDPLDHQAPSGAACGCAPARLATAKLTGARLLRRLQYRRLFFLGTDRRGARARARLGALSRSALSRADSRRAHTSGARGCLSRFRRAANGDRAGAALRRAGRPPRHGPPGISYPERAGRRDSHRHRPGSGRGSGNSRLLRSAASEDGQPRAPRLQPSTRSRPARFGAE